MNNDEKSPDYQCPYLGICDFIQHYKVRMPELIARTEAHFCFVQDSYCARRMLYQTVHQRYVPPLLLPNQVDWAREIMNDLKDEPGAFIEAEKESSKHGSE